MLRLLLSGLGGGEPVDGYVRRLVERGVRETCYDCQTMDYTCGAITDLTAAVYAGEPPELDRDHKMVFWRETTNFPACEPLGLTVVVRKNRPDAASYVDLDTKNPVLLDQNGNGEASCSSGPVSRRPISAFR